MDYKTYIRLRRTHKVLLDNGIEVNYSPVRMNKQPHHKLVKDCYGHYLLLNPFNSYAYEIAYQTCLELDLL